MSGAASQRRGRPQGSPFSWVSRPRHLSSTEVPDKQLSDPVGLRVTWGIAAAISDSLSWERQRTSPSRRSW